MLQCTAGCVLLISRSKLALIFCVSCYVSLIAAHRFKGHRKQRNWQWIAHETVVRLCLLLPLVGHIVRKNQSSLCMADIWSLASHNVKQVNQVSYSLINIFTFTTLHMPSLVVNKMSCHSLNTLTKAYNWSLWCTLVGRGSLKYAGTAFR